jgi:hypothetical protein
VVASGMGSITNRLGRTSGIASIAAAKQGST